MKTLLTTTLIAGLAAAGAQADVIYANDDFEGEAAGTFSTTANSTSFINTANSAGNVEIVDASGNKYVSARGNRDKHITLADAMELVTDGVESIDLDFMIQFNNTASTNDGRILYSASGDFTDSVLVGFYSPTSDTADPANGLLAPNVWYAQSITIAKADVGGSFTDTAKLRFANDGSGAFGDRVNFDDIVITGVVPEPGSLALLGLGGLLIARRRRS